MIGTCYAVPYGASGFLTMLNMIDGQQLLCKLVFRSTRRALLGCHTNAYRSLRHSTRVRAPERCAQLLHAISLSDEITGLACANHCLV